MVNRILKKAAIASAVVFIAAACGKPAEKVLIDGSSTVYPITEAVAETFRTVNPKTAVTVGTSGTGGGFKKFCNGETDISNASRPIKETEIELCAKNKIEYIELAVAYDGLAVLVNPKNTYIKSVTTEDLKKIFAFGSSVKSWKDLNPAFPDMPVKVFSPGQDSGTYDYFIEAIIGHEGRVRADSTFSEDDNILVTGIAGEEGAIGFFGIAYYEENKDSLKVLPVINPETKEAVIPSEETVKNGTYAPLSRPLYIYVRREAAEKEHVIEFLEHYLSKAPQLSKEVGYIPLSDDIYTLMQSRVKKKITGTVYGGKTMQKGNLADIFKE